MEAELGSLFLLRSPSHRSSTTTQSGAVTPATPTSGSGMSSSTSSNTLGRDSHISTQDRQSKHTDGSQTTPRMFGDTLHLHRTLNNSKQVSN